MEDLQTAHAHRGRLSFLTQSIQIAKEQLPLYKTSDGLNLFHRILGIFKKTWRGQLNNSDPAAERTLPLSGSASLAVTTITTVRLLAAAPEQRGLQGDVRDDPVFSLHQKPIVQLQSIHKW